MTTVMTTARDIRHRMEHMTDREWDAVGGALLILGRQYRSRLVIEREGQAPTYQLVIAGEGVSRAWWTIAGLIGGDAIIDDEAVIS